ncbi:MAG: DNA polymerase III subunit beta [Ignavibacteria bacterium CG_4_8_14_3_um_filter_37_9]|nr:DNA polymerase III subunit beta [Ignavibacteria bacterium]OIO15809.1 MAG: DNA polymerase III subunit beta [Ignavibacteria bacterium CG1_02_37_35]PIS44845.1 MAG: DNA polymerase III subunit beta [Ignavibacteria bacterium CG08_land_8_20_14_0_20_37_9]PIW98838.1 MAG: DNA polymerase III subunit beta [Ignavibacteria bacterium CG_4_8_14_3_um_filter_37_9]PIX93954.1 MAG: DNA polymerase III subunit beta [Ignavibacteria bacterium CG_4_10_14_3_um_filter_37_18]PJC58807.1 MAG: DNA polymerase III subunit b
MNFKINSKQLDKLLGKVFPAIPVRTTMSVLENFLFEIEDGVLTVSATDLEIALRTSLNVDADENLSMVVPAKLLFDVVKSLGDTMISFATESNQKMILTTENGQYAIGFASAEEFPKLPVIQKEKSITLSGKTLKKAIDKTSFAISKEAMRPAMMGALLECTEGGLTFVATDGHRLVKFIDQKVTFTEHENYILPERAVGVLGKLVNDNDLTLFLSETHLSFVMDDVEFSSRLIAQKYPDYTSVIPIENENKLKIHRGDLHAAIKRMLLFSTSNYQQVKFSISASSLEVSSEDIDKGSSAKETIGCTYTGEPMDIGFNTAYANDILTHLDEGEIQFKLHSPTKACVIEPVEKTADEELLMLLMPVRLNS